MFVALVARIAPLPLCVDPNVKLGDAARAATLMLGGTSKDDTGAGASRAGVSPPVKQSRKTKRQGPPYAV